MHEKALSGKKELLRFLTYLLASSLSSYLFCLPGACDIVKVEVWDIVDKSKGSSNPFCNSYMT